MKRHNKPVLISKKSAVFILAALLSLIFSDARGGEPNIDEDTSACAPVYAFDTGPSFERLHEIELLSEHADLPRFSPDGKWLAYKTLPGGPGKKAGVSGFVTNITGAHIHLIRADLPCPERGALKCEGEDFDLSEEVGISDASFPTFSPDARELFFTSVVYTGFRGKMAPTQQIFVASIEPNSDGVRTVRQLTAPPPGDPYISNRIVHISKDWSAATWTRFNSHNKDSLHDLLKLRVTICMGKYDPVKRSLSKCEPIFKIGPDPIFMPVMRWFEAKGLSADGSMLYYSGTPEVVTNPEIFVRPTKGGRPKRLTRTGPCVWDEQFAFSVGGNDELLIFSSNRHIKRPCKNFYDTLRSPNFPFLPPMETYYVPIKGGKVIRMTYGADKGAERSTIAINPADPTDAVLMEIFPGPPRRVRHTRIKFPCK